MSECPGVKNYKWRLDPVWHRMLYSCTHMATVGVRGLTTDSPVNALTLVPAQVTYLLSGRSMIVQPCITGYTTASRQLNHYGPIPVPADLPVPNPYPTRIRGSLNGWWTKLTCTVALAKVEAKFPLTNWQRLCSLSFITVLQTYCEGPNNGGPSIAKFHEGPDPRTLAGSTPMLKLM